MNRKAFTLIELLVVIAIIAILAAILFPVFARAREKALQTQCLSNLKQIVMGLRMYAADYSGTFPANNGPWNYTGSYAHHWWMHSKDTSASCVSKGFADYIGNDQIWMCPAYPETLRALGPSRGGGAIHTSYLANDYYMMRYFAAGLLATCSFIPVASPTALYFQYGWGGDNSYQGYVTEDMLSDPGMFVAFAEGFPDQNGQEFFCSLQSPVPSSWALLDVGLTADPPYWPSWDCYTKVQSTDYPIKNTLIGWHQGKMDTGFIDGHAKTMDIGSMVHTASKIASTTTEFYNPYFCFWQPH